MHSPAPLATGLMWFRRDLRSHDNAALYHALKRCQRVWCVFVFDADILTPLPRQDRRVDFILASLHDLNQQLSAHGHAHGHAHVQLVVRHGKAVPTLAALAEQLGALAVFANHDDEPAALARDAQVRGELAHRGIAFHTYKDHVIFERQEVMTQTDKPYTVFTPYKNAWLRQLTDFHLKAYPTERYAHALADVPAALQRDLPSLSELDFEASNLAQLPLATGSAGALGWLQDFASRIERYHETRDFPAVKGPSCLSVHLRFGTLSIRQCAGMAWAMHLQGLHGASVWLSELIWRDFYAQILANYPHVVGHAFKPEYDRIKWAHGKTAQAHFEAWCQGRTGYPLVDAAMHQLNQSGYMHNRLRMVVASFLTKDLGLDWRWGEAYFAQQLLDFDLSANNGGWQWAASSGCDAQPYFRIFNPVTQSEKFDPQGKFIKRYLPQLAALDAKTIHAPWLASPLVLAAAGVTLGAEYPHPIVDHAQAREATLARYEVVKAKTNSA